MEEIEKIVKRHEKSLKRASDSIFNEVYSIAMEDTERPSWCFLPVGTSLDLILRYTKNVADPAVQLGAIAHANLLSCIGAWRLTKDIIRLDKSLLDEILKTEFTGKLPTEAFMRMPSFCTYVEYPTERFQGFFFALEKSKGESDPELRIWWVKSDGDFLMTPVHLGDWTVEESFKRAEEYVREVTDEFDKPEARVPFEDEHLNDALNIVLYLCAQNAEYSKSDEKPSRPYPHKTKRGLKFFEADKARIWQVGEATGKQLREQREAAVKSGHSLKPHIRRAHWHGFWSGPRDAEKRKYDVKWLPPIFVGQ